MPATIEAAAAWLLDSKQPPTAAMASHFGEMTLLDGRRLVVETVPAGWYSGPGGERGSNRTARFHLRAQRHDQSPESTEPDPDPFTPEEIAEITSLLEAQGLHVEDQWGHDEGFQSWQSFGLVADRATSLSLRRALGAYFEGSPFDRPPGWAARCERLRPPTWPYVDAPAPAGAGDWPTSEPDDDRNLEAVREALERLAPVIAAVGVHPATMTAGRRGRIEGDPGALVFETEAGHGVQFPAEAAIELVRLALIGAEFEGQT